MLFVKSLLGKVTVWPETKVAVPMPGQAVLPDGRLVVVTVQLEIVVLMVKSCGNVIAILFSTSVVPVEGLAQTVPERGEETFTRSSLREL